MKIGGLTPSYEYEFIKWIVFIFLGSAFYTIFLQYLGTRIIESFQKLPLTSQISQADVAAIGETIGLAVLIFFIPVMISIVSTKILPEKRIVPPLFLHLIALAYFIFVFLANSNFSDEQKFASSFVILIYSIFVGLSHDSIVIGLLGRSVREKDVIRYSIRSTHDVEYIENIIMREKFRDVLRLSSKIEEIHNGVRLRSKKIALYDAVVEIKKGDEDNSIINMAFFQKGAYFYKISDGLIEYSRQKKLYLEDTLTRNNCIVKELSESNAEPLVTSILEDAGGLYSQTGGISPIGWVKIVSFIVVFAIAIALLVYGKVTEGAIALSVVLLYLVFDLPNKIISRRK